jgi:hypothetical protein
MSHQNSKLNIDDIGKKLGLTPQFLFEAANAASTQYMIFDLPKRAGGVRTICSPKNELKRIQRAILEPQEKANQDFRIFDLFEFLIH